jgi:peptidoglycan/LPS O-acetylase OafA/YrhL
LPTVSNSAIRPAMPVSSSRIPELDGLRGLAIFVVLLSHYLSGSGHLGLPSVLRQLVSATSIGWSGVDLFFVLSGFLIGGILLDARSAPHYFRAFYMRRIFRIFPIYYLWILLFTVVALLALSGLPFPVAVHRQNLLQIPIQLAFLQNMQFSSYEFPYLWFTGTWSLAVEEQFYLLAPPLIRFLSRRRLIAVLAATIVFAPFIRLYVFYHIAPGTFAATYLLPCRADTLACGILLAAAWREPRFLTFLQTNRRQLQLLLGMLILGVLLALHSLIGPLTLLHATLGYSWFALLYSTLLVLVLSDTGGWLAAAMRLAPLRSLGLVSYCVYIIHSPIHQFAPRILLHAPPEINSLPGLLIVLLGALLTFLLAALSWRFFESPLLRRGHLYHYGPAASPGATAGADPAIVDSLPSAFPGAARP